MPRIFGHGGLRLVLLSLLEDGPRHGYELIIALEDRFMGMYRPSSGTVYPRLSALEYEGLISSDESGGKRVYRITDAGRSELARRRAELEDTVNTATTTVQSVMDEIQADIRAAFNAVHSEVRRQTSPSGEARHVADDVRRAGSDLQRDARRVADEARRAATDEAKRARRLASDLRRQAQDLRRQGQDQGRGSRTRTDATDSEAGPRFEFDELAAEVSAWASEAGDQVRRHLPDEAQRARLRTALADARRAFMETLSGSDQGSDAT